MSHYSRDSYRRRRQEEQMMFQRIAAEQQQIQNFLLLQQDGGVSEFIGGQTSTPDPEPGYSVNLYYSYSTPVGATPSSTVNFTNQTPEELKCNVEYYVINQNWNFSGSILDAFDPIAIGVQLYLANGATSTDSGTYLKVNYGASDTYFVYTLNNGVITNIENFDDISDYYLASEFYFDPGNTASYPGSGTTLTNVGDIGDVTGTLGTMSGVSYNSGLKGGVFDFDGVSDKITFGQYDFGNVISVSAWVYPRTEASINNLMANCAANTNTNGFKLSWNNWNTTNYTMNLEAGNGSAGGTMSTAVNTVTLNTWQLLTYIFDKANQTITFYLNGQYVAQSSGGTPVANIGMNNSNWWIGSIGGNSYNMNAYMGEFRIWKESLDVARLFQAYNKTRSRYE